MTRGPRDQDPQARGLEEKTQEAAEARPETPVWTEVSGLPHRSLRSISGPTPKPAPRTVRRPLRRRHRRLTGVSGPDQSLRPTHRSLQTKRIRPALLGLGLAHVMP